MSAIVRVSVSPDMLQWACQRAGYEVPEVAERIPQLQAWVRSEGEPTLRQLEKLANLTRTPLGYLLLSEPPDEPLPVPDFRTVAGARFRRPSPDLLETIYTMQRRQDWLRESFIKGEADRLPFVESASLSDPPRLAARQMRQELELEGGWAAEVAGWEAAVSELRRRIEGIGVMAVINSLVGNNTRRQLDVAEFRGFALADPYAPLVFVNGADAKSAQMFTLAHELAHIWLGSEGVSGFERMLPPDTAEETWCDQAAAEFLAPEEEVRQSWEQHPNVEAVARSLKVSPIVAARRGLDLGLMPRRTFFSFYERYVKRERKKQKDGGGGDFYNLQNTRVGELFATEVVHAALEGRIGFKEAYDLTGLRGGTFQKYATKLGAYLP